MNADLSDLLRLLQNLIRLGTIAEVKGAKARVRLGPTLTTKWLNWATPRAGSTRTWSAPTVGEQVIVFSPGGDLTRGIILPALYSQEFDAPDTSDTIHTTHYPDGAVVQYDHASHALTATLPGGTATITADKVTSNAPSTICTGDLTVMKNLIVKQSTTVEGATNLIDTFKQQQEHSFHKTTVGAIIEAIAFRNELASGVSARLRDIAIEHIDQTHESDAAFLRRLGRKYDAVATVKNDTLLFIPINQSRTASGKALPVIPITRALGDGHRYHSAESDAYTGVRAFWHDERYARRRSVVAGVPGNSKRLRTTFANETDARAAAVAEWQRILRGLATFEMSLALGNPAVFPQSPVTVQGFKPEIDATEWLSVKVTHNLGGSGFTTRVEFETKTEAVEAEREDEKDPDEGITGVVAKWKDVAAKKKKAGQEQAGTAGTLKTLEHLYKSRQAAKRAALQAWKNIEEVREIIRENSEEPWRPT